MWGCRLGGEAGGDLGARFTGACGPFLWWLRDRTVFGNEFHFREGPQRISDLEKLRSYECRKDKTSLGNPPLSTSTLCPPCWEQKIRKGTRAASIPKELLFKDRDGCIHRSRQATGKLGLGGLGGAPQGCSERLCPRAGVSLGGPDVHHRQRDTEVQECRDGGGRWGGHSPSPAFQHLLMALPGFQPRHL